MSGAMLLHPIYAIMVRVKIILPSAVPMMDPSISFYISLFFLCTHLDGQGDELTEGGDLTKQPD